MGPQPRLFHYSLDWRFILPLNDPQKIFLLLEEDLELSQALEQVGIGASQQFSFSRLRQNANGDIPSLVLPFGISKNWSTARPAEQADFYGALRGLIASGGYLLIGFNNVWNQRASSQNEYYPATPRRMVNQLEQAGFRSVAVFGAMPNLAIPEYIFELRSRTILFALQNRFRRKPAILSALRILSKGIGASRLSNFLPCYFAVATG